MKYQENSSYSIMATTGRGSYIDSSLWKWQLINKHKQVYDHKRLKKNLKTLYVPWEKKVLHMCLKLESHSPKDTLCPVWRKLSLKVVNAFAISSWYRAWPSIWNKNFISNHPKINCAKFVWNLPCCFGEEHS